MNRKNNIITRARVLAILQTALLAGLVFAVTPRIARAHGGEEHVIGTVAKIAPGAVTVKTTAGKMVDVAFDAKTVYTRGTQPVKPADIKVGDRVVIHAVEVNEKLTAHTVELGTAKKAAAKH